MNALSGWRTFIFRSIRFFILLLKEPHNFLRFYSICITLTSTSDINWLHFALNESRDVLVRCNPRAGFFECTAKTRPSPRLIREAASGAILLTSLSSTCNIHGIFNKQKYHIEFKRNYYCKHSLRNSIFLISAKRSKTSVLTVQLDTWAICSL